MCCEQVRRDVGLRLDHAGERLLPGLQDRVVGVPLVEGHGAVVRVDGGLDRVAHVVDLVGRQRGVRRARVERVGRSSPAATPSPPAGTCRWWCSRRGSTRSCRRPRPGSASESTVSQGATFCTRSRGRAVVEDLAVLVDPPGEHDVGVAELHGVEQLVEHVADPARRPCRRRCWSSTGRACRCPAGRRARRPCRRAPCRRWSSSGLCSPK